MSARTRSKVNQLDQSVGVSTRSKLQWTYSFIIQTLLFPLNDILPLSNHEKYNDENPQLWVKQCKAYHDGLIQSKSIMGFNSLRHLHILDITEEGRETSWQCSKMLK